MKESYKDIALDRLIYQTDSCRIFHFQSTDQDQAIRGYMTSFPNQKIWRLAYDEAFVDDKDIHEGYLIYHLRSNG